MRPTALSLLLCLAACSSLSSDEYSRLASHQRNAKYYFDGAHYEQALDQIERGLEIDADDYVLNSMRGAILLMRSGDASGTDHTDLDAATKVLTRIYETRSPNRHEPHLLVNYGLALEKQGRRHLAVALRLEQDVARKGGDPGASAAEREQARSNLLEARTAFGVLVDRGEQLRIAHYHRLLIAETLQDEAAFGAEAKAYFEVASRDQETVRKEIERTTVANYEAAKLQQLRMLHAEELEVRSLVAGREFAAKRYDEALVHLNRVLELDPQRSADYYNRGRVLLSIGRTVEAKDDFRKFLATTTLPSGSEKKAFAQEALAR